ncbi:ATP-binding cassette domain-containing protein [Paenibacillus xylanexedens]|uniref:ATP-binding cassette subfamily B protein n=1 Tax=Paenibacillus xylanexedens TaxID=528191 RepID=A0ABS4RYU9_PAEXY|nr:ABC transporter ATP-binding protein [Paenibacillus xylanexedens]MBP2247469.1 ATP-binding cassette subfamily B protein [Paenibacillus xylanexedens]
MLNSNLELLKVADIIRKHNWKIIVVHLVMMIFLSLQANFNVYLSGKLLDFLNESVFSQAIFIIILITVFNFLKQFLSEATSLMDEEAMNEIMIKHEMKILDKMRSFNLIDQEKSEFKSSINMATMGMGKIFPLFSNSFGVLQNGITAMIAFWYLGVSSLWLVLFVVIITCSKTLLIFYFTQKRISTNRVIQSKLRVPQYFYNVLIDTQTQKELKVYGSSDVLVKKWKDSSEEIQKIRNSLKKYSINFNLFNFSLSNLGLALVTILIINYMSKGQLSIGEYFGLTLSLNLADNSISTLLRNIFMIKEDKNYVKSYFSFVDNPDRQEADLGKNEKVEFVFENQLTINNLSFRYTNSERYALRNINLSINKGDKVVIFGENGSGKTTFLKLLLKLYDSPEKTIAFDNIPLEQIRTSSLHQAMVVVFQDFVKYMMTIRENVIISNSNRSEITDAQIIKALGKSRFPKLDRFSNHMDTDLGYLTEQSVFLSGGEWQKLALSRVYIRDAELLVFDEPTSALDPKSEIEFFSSILTEKDKTVIVVTHDINIAELADTIVVFKDGEIAEVGNAQELYKRENSEYRNIINKRNEIFSMERKYVYG